MLKVSDCFAFAAAANSSVDGAKRSMNGTLCSFATSAIAAVYFCKFALSGAAGGRFGSLLGSAAMGENNTRRALPLPL